MAQTPMQRRSSTTWLWIVLGIVVVIAVIWWAGDTGPTIPQDTTGAGIIDTAQPAATKQSGNPGAAGVAAPSTAAQASGGTTD